MSDLRPIEISVIVPVLNEAENLPLLLPRLSAELSNLGDYEIIIVDDGSTDATLVGLQAAVQLDPRLRYVSLSKNFGHQAALRAGLEFARGQCAISMDGDLQHPVELLQQMVERWRGGDEIVTTIRNDPERQSFLKRKTSRAFYSVLNWLSDVKIEPGSADFRLLDRKVIDVINGFTESDFFLRGIVPWVGFKSSAIQYTPNERMRGKTKYSWRRMTSLALAGIVSSSIRPLRLATAFAVIIAGAAVLYSCYALVAFLKFGWVVPGWTSVILAVSLIGSLQLLVLGVIGEYLGRTLREVRKRPKFIVRQTNCQIAEKRSS